MYFKKTNIEHTFARELAGSVLQARMGVALSASEVSIILLINFGRLVLPGCRSQAKNRDENSANEAVSSLARPFHENLLRLCSRYPATYGMRTVQNER